MGKNKAPRKLTVKKDSIRKLIESDLRKAAGGMLTGRCSTAAAGKCPLQP
jgi:hypothetical protein